MEESFTLVQQLVADFQSQEAAYLSPHYQESQVRQDFIDKFFTALGWDVTHERQKNPYEQEVKIENRVNASGSQRRADYAFSIAPNFRTIKFFVEAKKPSRNLANADDYYQAIRYGWNQGTPLAVLTDFEEFHILDCRYKPDIKSSLDRKITSFRYTDYTNEEIFARIFHLFGREAVANGSLEKFTADLPKPKGKAAKGAVRTIYQQVDESFLELLDGYREALAKEFKNHNQHLDGEELTEAVQRTLDRLVFIRFLEDKSIEEPAIIGLSAKPSAWKAFTALCRALEPKYNGLVFKPHRILDGDAFMQPGNKVFGAICAELSDPSSPYDFDGSTNVLGTGTPRRASKASAFCSFTRCSALRRACGADPPCIRHTFDPRIGFEPRRSPVLVRAVQRIGSVSGSPTHGVLTWPARDRLESGRARSPNRCP